MENREIENGELFVVDLLICWFVDSLSASPQS